MPSDLAYWLISAPLHDGDTSVILQDTRRALGAGAVVGGWEMPELKAGTLSSLLALSDNLPKLDASFTSAVSKLLDTLRSLVADDKTRLAQHARVNDRPADDYLVPDAGGSTGWRWDRSRWGEGGKVSDVVDALSKEMASIEQMQKQKSQSYNLAKGQLTNLQRKRLGNLSQRSLIDVVDRGKLVENSEFLETLLVAVPKNLTKDWNDKYERLTSMVVPRSSEPIAADDEFTLVTVTVFKKVRDEFTHKCRENKFIVRDFTYDETAAEKQKKELAQLEAEEKELWTDLLKVSRINFSEAFQLLTHLKTVRLFVESVLRYGLPADYAGVVVKPDPKTAVKTLKTLSAHFNYLASSSQGPTAKKTKAGAASGAGGDVAGEWATVMEQEYYDFVLFEIPKVEI
ncbi:Vacuolar ATP synthase subunit C [Cryptotrichosporon argae]